MDSVSGLAYLTSLLPVNSEPAKIEIDLNGFSDGQKRVIKSIISGKNVLMTGPAGTGKSFTIEKIKEIYQKQGKHVGITSTTGASAIIIGGRTIHSFSGIGICNSKESALKRVMTYRKPKRRLETTDLLIIDEISMMSGDLLDILEYVCRIVRQNNLPFGGMQILLVGDFYQLSPVKASKYAFEASCWDNSIHEVIELEHIFRQNNQAFCKVLNEIRQGDVSMETIEILSECIDREFGGDIVPTELYPLKADVSELNEYQLWELATEENNIIGISALDEIIDKPKPKKPHPKKFLKECRERLNKHCVAPETLQVCIGAQVMLIKNIDVEGGLANGSRGVVIGFGPQNQPIVKFLNGHEVVLGIQKWTMRINETTQIRRSQYPIILAWAITIHKCISGDSLISTTNGLIKIEQLAQGYSKGWNKISLGVHSSEKNSIAKALYVGEVEDSIRITTHMGFTLKGSYRHPVLTINESGEEIWKKLPEINEGDTVIIRYGLENDDVPTTIDFQPNFEYIKTYKLPQVITPDLCYLMGLLVGGGSYNKDMDDYVVEYTSLDHELIHKFKSISKSSFGIKCDEYIKKEKVDSNRKSISKEITKVCFCSKLIRMYLVKCGLSFTSCKDKHIPWSCMYNTKESQRAFLKGLFDAHGSVSPTCIHFTSTSTILAREIQILLCNLGIIARLYYVKNGDEWRIELSGQAARDYMTTIGFNIGYKQSNGSKIYGQNIKTDKFYKGSIGVIPGGQQLIKDLRSQKYAKHNCKSQCPYIKKPLSSFLSKIINGQELRIGDLEYIIESMPDIDEFEAGQKISRYVNNRWFFDTVKTITRSQCQMYDLEVEETHSFVSNSIVSHNCQGATVDRLRVDLGSRIFEDGQSYTALSRVKNLEGLSIASVDWDKITCNQKVKQFYEKYKQKSNSHFEK